MTTAEMATFIHKTALIHDGKMEFEVMICDARNRYGTIDFLVRPIVGRGERWVSQERLNILED